MRAPAPAPGLAEGAPEKRAVVKKDHHGGRHHDLLRRHAAKAGQPSRPEPTPCPAPGRRLRSAQEAVQRQEVAKAHQRLGPLDDVGDGRGLQRVEGPKEGDGEGEEAG